MGVCVWARDGLELIVAYLRGAADSSRSFSGIAVRERDDSVVVQ